MNRKLRYVYKNIVTDEILYCFTSLEEMIGILPSPNVEWPEDEDCVLISRDLYTTKKDINENEIYEGDIVQPYHLHTRVNCTGPCIIKWIDNGFHMCDNYSESIWYYDVEIIGNIHENKDLINDR